MIDLPLVSVIAVCYNHQDYVIEALESIINQTYKRVELIVIDANSSDNSCKLIEQWIEQKSVDCVFIKQNSPKNVCQNLNEGLQHINGEYFQGFSCDDVMMPEKIETQIKYFQEHQDIALIHSSAERIDEDGMLIEGSFTLDQNMIEGKQDPFSLLKKLVWGNAIIAPSALIKVSCLPPLPVYDETYRLEDLYLNFRLLIKGHQFFFIEKPLVRYRVLTDSVMRKSSNRLSLKKERIRLLREFLNADKELDQEIFTYVNRNIKIYDAFKDFIFRKMPYAQFRLKILNGFKSVFVKDKTRVGY